MSTWSVTTNDTSGNVLAHLRLGSYQGSESALKPKQYPSGEDFASSDGIFLTTTGNLYLNADGDIDVEFKDNADIVIGDFSSQSDVDLKIDATGSTGYIRARGKNVVLNAVDDETLAQAPESEQLMLYATNGITSTSTGDARFQADGDVYVKNDTESNTSTQSKTLTMGTTESVCQLCSNDLTAGFSVLIKASFSTTLTFYSSSTVGFGTGYAVMKNAIAMASQENKGMKAYLKNISGLFGVVCQEETFTEVKQEALANGASVCGSKLRILETKSKAVRSSIGVSSTM
ncbi:hypothetical protein [Amorphus coralli]|uniref:hypothetical protein n=1 Tax=Amorphus coralli TaxID=340680 RepID=UPI000364B336|nr:hypothetical protein [Amorphus coralli]